ncbi:MAG: Response regulator protein TmoT [Xanthobacteraceae bacterium]|jgi:FixJ family two-component response regulator|nr:Response regulator protein TmoT [Xanthobacteraceae bacterium]
MSEVTPNREVFVVDDDGSIRLALQFMLTQAGFSVTAFGDGRTFLGTSRTRTPSCLILDVRMPGLSGIEVLKELAAQRYQAPIVMMTGIGTIPLAVEAIRGGAFDIMQKPFEATRVATLVNEAIAASTCLTVDGPPPDCAFQTARARRALTRREEEVLTYITAGSSNKETARRLGISPRTIEIHRWRINEKLGAKNTADLVRIALTERPVV